MPMKKIRTSVIWGIFLFILTANCFCFSKNPSTSRNDTNEDKQQIIHLEKSWLKFLHNKVALDSILAPDFIHVLPQGIFITKEQQIEWEVKHPLPVGYSQKFDTLFVRIFGATGIANGIVETFDNKGNSIRKSAFTDVFEKRNGKWQAVNAQEIVVH